MYHTEKENIWFEIITCEAPEFSMIQIRSLDRRRPNADIDSYVGSTVVETNKVLDAMTCRRERSHTIGLTPNLKKCAAVSSTKMKKITT